MVFQVKFCDYQTILLLAKCKQFVFVFHTYIVKTIDSKQGCDAIQAVNGKYVLLLRIRSVLVIIVL